MLFHFSIQPSGKSNGQQLMLRYLLPPNLVQAWQLSGDDASCSIATYARMDWLSSPSLEML